MANITETTLPLGRNGETPNRDVPSAQKNSPIILPNEIPSSLKYDLRDIFKDEDISKCKAIFMSKESLRQELYELLANTIHLKKRSSDMLNNFVNYMENKMIPLNGRSIDILQLLVYDEMLPASGENGHPFQVKYLIQRVPLFPELRLHKPEMDKRRSVALAFQENEIGHQYIRMSSEPRANVAYSSSSSSASSASSVTDGQGDSPRKKPRLEKSCWLKICQEAKMVDTDKLAIHSNNFERSKSTVHCQVDILIFIDNEQVAKDVAAHLGLICLESIVGINDFSTLHNDRAKVYKLIQTLIAQKLMSGYSNIIVTSQVIVWDHIQANVRAAITSVIERILNGFNKSVDYLVKIEGDEILSSIKAVSDILNKSLSFNITTPVKYETPDKGSITIEFPITSLIPLYIVRYYTQGSVRICTSDISAVDSWKKLFM